MSNDKTILELETELKELKSEEYIADKSKLKDDEKADIKKFGNFFKAYVDELVMQGATREEAIEIMKTILLKK